MNVWQALLVFVAGIGAGTINTVVGSGTLLTFPVLLGVGLSPLTANVSNTLGLAPGSAVGALGYRRELDGQGDRVRSLGTASLIGGVGGAALLLVLPASAFKTVVPVLIALALVFVVAGPRLSVLLSTTRHAASTQVTPTLWFFGLLNGVYGGYFGAAQGVLLMGMLGLFLEETLQRQNALKNVMAGAANAAAAVVFVLVAHVNWTAAGLIAGGAILGAVLGARVGRRLSPTVLRGVIVVVGVAAIIKLLI